MASKRLVIVESPTKATKIAGFLGRDYIVESSRGHVRDLPTSASEVPAKYKGQSWARTGVDVDNDFQPIYVVSADKKSTIKDLKAKLAGVDELLLATDGDREGEAIAWHLMEELKPKVPVKRMVFHEITKSAIEEAVTNPRDIDVDLVDAQETRRILDRLYGYEVSPVLWKKVMPRLSAGRVQSVATRLVVDRERERIAFVTASYWDLDTVLDAGADADPRNFPARLATVGDAKVAQGRDFNSSGQLTSQDALVLDEEAARTLAEALREARLVVSSVDSKPYTRRPYEPFRTTTLQQEAGRKLGFTSERTMRVAQELYEKGFITYMRTDSVTLAGQAIRAAREQVKELYGERYLPEKPRVYASKVKNAQEAHEAIRPAGDTFAHPDQTGLSGDPYRLYQLIWRRTLASQMADARGESLSIRIDATHRPVANGATTSGLVASGRTITFPGFLQAYVQGVDDDSASDDAQTRLPILTKGQELAVAKVDAVGHETRPPARYTEPSLVAKLEELEIGRPSTYASIIRTITARDYVFKKGSALVPTWLAFAVTRLLEEHFSELVDYAFTAQLEDRLDDIAAGKAERLGVLSDFYRGPDGSAHHGLETLVTELGDIDARALSTFPLGDSGIDVRVGRYGTYVESSDGRRANVPEDMAPDALTVDVAEELLSRPLDEERELGVDESTGTMIVAKNGRYGPYVTEILPEDAPKSAKPRTGSLFKDMSLDDVDLPIALQLLNLPRVVGKDSEGNEITAQNGRYGPYLKRGTDSRSLTAEDQIFTITLEEALAIYAQPKTRGRAAAAAPLKEFGEDPASGKPVVLKSGRFGPYVTDGETNATLRRDDDPESVTPERAFELLAEKRAKGPAKKPARKPAARKSTAKKTTTSRKKTT
ncbi:type I DNA topoisomerase [Tessaracoccus flavus]|uniref:DNA topoisomerase 1 n=1 Tax=Tessaracoccus flavus TaxID=1610493 RepID=A0A1Q2CIM1_9ACTN|nr:type I DNA topoisomerase [Tessaracoccus flavus]AQP45957.1 DNA topoisomerase I [Tessaracoccus flavus]SDZ01678.1 DNA topoisomerase I [Tessaracoccus flavus]